MKFKSLKQYHDMLKVQMFFSILIGGILIPYEQYRPVPLVMFFYTLFCLYLAYNYYPTIDTSEKRMEGE